MSAGPTTNDKPGTSSSRTLWLVLAVVLMACAALGYVLVTRGQVASPGPDVTGQLLTDVSVAIADAQAEKAALEHVVGRLDETAAALGENVREEKVDTDFDKLQTALEAESAAEKTPPHSVSMRDTVSLFEENEEKLVNSLSRLTPRLQVYRQSGPSRDEAALSELWLDFDRALRAAVPANVETCRNDSKDPTITLKSGQHQAKACLDLLRRLESWLGDTASALTRECVRRKDELSKRIAAADSAISAKQAQSGELQRSLRSASALDNLVRWGFPAMAGVVAVLFLIVRSFESGLQKTIVQSRLLLDVVTLLVLLTAILILGLSGKIESEVLGTLIGGITGYTLGRAAVGERQSRQDGSDESGGGQPPPASQKESPHTNGGDASPAKES